MTNLKRPGLLAVALAVVFAFTIGGPLHTFEHYPGDEAGASPANFSEDKLSEEQSLAAFDGIGGLSAAALREPSSSLSGDEGDGSEQIEAAVEAIAVASAGVFDHPPVDDAVGGPIDGEAGA